MKLQQKKGADCLLFVRQKEDRCGMEWYGWRCTISNWVGFVHNATDDFTLFFHFTLTYPILTNATHISNLRVNLGLHIVQNIIALCSYMRWLIACLLDHTELHICKVVVNSTDILLKSYVNICKGPSTYAYHGYGYGYGINVVYWNSGENKLIFHNKICELQNKILQMFIRFSCKFLCQMLNWDVPF